MAVIKPKSRPFPRGRVLVKPRWGILSAVGIFIIVSIILLIVHSDEGDDNINPLVSQKKVGIRRKGSTLSSSSQISTTPTVRLRSGLEMPAIGYGTCCRPSAKGEEIYKSTKLFLEYGGRLIDTAMAYGNHVEIGRAIQDSSSFISRKNLWITSKIAPGKVRNYDDCLRAVDSILEELNTSYLDLILIHSPKRGKESTIGFWKALIEAKRLGKTRAIGVSNFNRGEIQDIVDATNEWPEVNQIQQHPWSSEEWKKLANWQHQNNIITIAYTSLGGSRNHKKKRDGTSALLSSSWPDTVTNIAHSHDVNEAAVMLRWALQSNFAVIPGSGNKDHIRENIILPEVFELSSEEMTRIENAPAPEAWFDSKRGPNKYGDEEASIPWYLATTKANNKLK